MRQYLLDTNILLLYIRKDTRFEYIDSHYEPFSLDSTPLISFVTEGEFRSIALQRDWGIS